MNEKDQLEVPSGFPPVATNYVTEPSGRVVGLWSRPDAAQLYVQDPANGRFAGLHGTDQKAVGIVASAAWISSRHATLLGTSQGLFSLSADEQTISRVEVAGATIGQVRWINDLPRHQAVAIGADGGAFILDSDNGLHEIPGFKLPSPGYVIFSELDQPDRLLIQANEELWIAPLRRDGHATIPDRAHRITSYVFDGNVLRYYPAIGRYLVYAKLNSWFGGGHALLQLRDELNAVAGSAGLDHPFIRDLPSRGLVSIETFTGGIYTYDGTSALKPVPGSTKAEIGAYPKVYDLPGQHKVIVVATRGLYELTADGHIDRLPLPPALEGAEFSQLAEMPASHLAVVFTDRGMFELDPAGNLLPIAGGTGSYFGITGVSVVARIPGREALFVATNHNGSFLILDRDRVGKEACAADR